ncbi:TnsA-like heteromeric transposase endonuclease subunit [Amycolatopsis magusensis]
MRPFPSYRGRRNYPGFYYAATMNVHVPFESWLERDTALDLDFTAEVVSFAAQPFWLSWPGGGRVRSHVPDFFARTADGTGVVVDCRPAERVRPRDAEASPQPSALTPRSRLALPAGHRARPDLAGEPPLAHELPAPALPPRQAGRTAARGVHPSTAAGRGRRAGRRPGRGAPGRVPPALGPGSCAPTSNAGWTRPHW